MSRARPKDFVRLLRMMGVELAPREGAGETLAHRPRRLLRRLERKGISVEYSRPRPEVLAAYGFAPATVFDIGVDQGTPLIYEAFPDAHFVLIDPLEECADKIRRWEGKIDFSFECCAVGAKPGKVTLRIPSTEAKVRHSRASALDFEPRNAAQFSAWESREVPVRTLDQIARGRTAPFGIKIDTEGYELEVLRGARKALKKTEFVIAEASVKRRYKGGYRFSELIAELGRNGFEIYDFLKPLRPDAADCDVLFARWDSDRFDF